MASLFGAHSRASATSSARRRARHAVGLAAVALGALASGLWAPPAGAGVCATAPTTGGTVLRWDGGAGTTAWGAAANWVGDVLPTTDNHVCIPSTAPGAAEVVFSTGTVSVRSIDSQNPFTISGGTLSLTDTNVVSTFTQGLRQSGGTLQGNANKEISGASTWSAGGLAGAGQLTNVAGGTLTLNGTLSKSLDAKLQNLGTINVQGTGELYFGTNSILTNAGAINLLTDAPIGCCFGTGRHEIINTATGTIVKKAGALSVIDPPIDNDGIIRSEAGRIELVGGTPAGATAVGRYAANTGTELALTAGTYLVGAGAAINGPAPVDLDGATITGPLSIPNTARLVWTSGYLGGAAGAPVTVAAGGTLDVVDTAPKSLYAGVRNLGTVNISGTVSLEDLGILTNEAALNLLENAFVDCCFGSGPHGVVNTATGVITHTGAAASVSRIDAPIDNDGLIQSSSGRLNLLGGTMAGRPSAGRHVAAAGATLSFEGGTFEFDAPGATGGAGQVLVSTTFSGPYKVEAASTLTLTAGSLNGPPELATAVNAGTIHASGLGGKYLSGMLRNDGTLRIEGYLGFDELTLVTNRGTIDIVGTSQIDCCFGTAPHSIVNLAAGVIKKSGAAGTTANVEVPIDNDGIVRSDVGILNLTGGTPAGSQSNGSYSALAAQTLRFSAGLTELTNRGNIAGPGTVNVAGGELYGAWIVKATARISFTGGTLTGPSDGVTTASIERGGVITAATSAGKYISGSIKNDGLISVTGYLGADTLAQVTNTYLFEVSGAATVDCCFGTGPHGIYNSATGTVRKVGIGSTARIEIPVDNDGITRSLGGTLDLTNGSGAGRESVGEYSATTGNVVRFNGGSHLMGVGSRILGPGQVVLFAGDVTGFLTVKSGGRMSLQGGSLVGPSVDAGSLVVDVGGSITATTAAGKYLEGTFRNDGLFKVDGYLGIDVLTRFVNNGTFELAGAPTVDCCFGTAPHILVNSPTGIVRKTGASTSVARVEIPLENDGIVRAEGGALELSNGSGAGQSAGEYTAFSSGAPTVRFTGGIHLIAVGGRITGPGTVTLAGGELRGPLTVKSGGNLSMLSGDLQAPLNGTGHVLVETGGIMRTSTAAGKYLRGPLRNEGTLRWEGYVGFDTLATVTNVGTFELSGASTIDCCFGSGAKQITNGALGIVRVVSGYPRVEPPFKNEGTVVVEDVAGVLFTEPLDFTSGVLRYGTWHIRGDLGLRTGGLTQNVAQLTLDGPQAALVDEGGVDDTPLFFKNVGRLTVKNRALSLPAFVNTGTMEIQAGASVATPQLRQMKGLLLLDSAATLTSPDVIIEGGALQGGGLIDGPLRSTGSAQPQRLQPGAELDITGAFVQTSTGTLEVELTSAGPGLVQRQLLGTRNAALAGTLRVRVTDTFTAVNGDTYTLGTFNSVTGRFATLDIEVLPNGLELVPFYTPTSFGVLVQAVPAP